MRGMFALFWGKLRLLVIEANAPDFIEDALHAPRTRIMLMLGSKRHVLGNGPGQSERVSCALGALAARSLDHSPYGLRAYFPHQSFRRPLAHAILSDPAPWLPHVILLSTSPLLCHLGSNISSPMRSCSSVLCQFQHRALVPSPCGRSAVVFPAPSMRMHK